MLTIKCSNCGKKIFKYEKIGKGRVLHCWRNRIVKDYSIRSGDEVRCTCGNVIGIHERRWIKMRQQAFTYSGTKGRR